MLRACCFYMTSHCSLYARLLISCPTASRGGLPRRSRALTSPSLDLLERVTRYRPILHARDSLLSLPLDALSCRRRAGPSSPFRPSASSRRRGRPCSSSTQLVGRIFPLVKGGSSKLRYRFVPRSLGRVLLSTRATRSDVKGRASRQGQARPSAAIARPVESRRRSLLPVDIGRDEDESNAHVRRKEASAQLARKAERRQGLERGWARPSQVAAPPFGRLRAVQGLHRSLEALASRLCGPSSCPKRGKRRREQLHRPSSTRTRCRKQRRLLVLLAPHDLFPTDETPRAAKCKLRRAERTQWVRLPDEEGRGGFHAQPRASGLRSFSPGRARRLCCSVDEQGGAERGTARARRGRGSEQLSPQQSAPRTSRAFPQARQAPSAVGPAASDLGAGRWRGYGAIDPARK